LKLSNDKTELVQAGGALVLTNPGSGGKLELQYSASFDYPGSDEITEKSLLLTSYWYPHIGRGASTSTTVITGPEDWEFFANGDHVPGTSAVGAAAAKFENKVAIPYFHVAAGPYKLAAETQDRGRTFRAWHLDKSGVERAKGDVESAKNAVAFFEDRYGTYPYNHYDIVDTPDYYGIECYSFTLLSPSISSWATSHEVGHTWFGGMVPNTYIKSIWNESLTQYIDSVVFKKNSDRSLNNGYSSRTAPVALADSLLAHGPYGNVGYYRGAYVMKMLENEIGETAMTERLSDVVRQRRGKKTEWSDIAAIYKLDWFFDQWVYGKRFPNLEITRAFTEAGPRGGFVTTIDIAQSGTPMPFRIKVSVVLTSGSGEKRQVVDLSKSSHTFYLESASRPSRVTLDPFGYTLASVPPPRMIGN
jgi:aminopeptidase N